MSKLYVHLVPRITRHSTKLGMYITVPEWEAKVPLVQSANDALVKAYADYFVSCGIGAVAAETAAHNTIQRTYAHGYIDGLKEAVARRAEEYALRWPELRMTIGKRAGLPLVALAGFKPEVIQAAYVPFQRPGRAGQAFVDDMLSSMAHEVLTSTTTTTAETPGNG